MHKRKFFLLTYIIVLNAILIVLLVANNTRVQILLNRVGLSCFTPEKSEFYRKMDTFYSRIDGTVPPGSVLFIGDSIVQGLCVQAIVDKGINLGIGTETTKGVVRRIASYRSVKTASAVIISVGVNDILWHQDGQTVNNYKEILAAVPAHIQIILTGILPIDERANRYVKNIKLGRLNEEIASHCSTLQNCSFLNGWSMLIDETGNLRPQYHTGDGIHLNDSGYQELIDRLRYTLQTSGATMDRGRPVDPRRALPD